MRCPHCQQHNPIGNQYCGNCGATLDANPLILRRNQNYSIAGYDVTPGQLRQIGVSLAVSVLALLAEAGLIYLRRRVQHLQLIPNEQSVYARARKKSEQTEIISVGQKSEPGEIVTVYRERVVEIRRWGRPVQRIIDRVALRREPK